LDIKESLNTSKPSIYKSAWNQKSCMFDIMGLEDRELPEVIEFRAKSKRMCECPSCKSKVEFNSYNGLCDVFCPYCRGRVKI
jgi:hypothetical protein